jgi:hypothetical protein
MQILLYFNKVVKGKHGITTISEKCTPKVQKAIHEVVDLIKGLL